MEKKLKTNALLYHLGEKSIKTALNIPEKQSKPIKVNPSEPLNKKLVQQNVIFFQMKQ